MSASIILASFSHDTSHCSCASSMSLRSLPASTSGFSAIMRSIMPSSRSLSVPRVPTPFAELLSRALLSAALRTFFDLLPQFLGKLVNIERGRRGCGFSFFLVALGGGSAETVEIQLVAKHSCAYLVTTTTEKTKYYTRPSLSAHKDQQWTG